MLAAIIGGFVVLWPTLDRIEVLEAPEWIRERVDRQITPGLDIQGGLRLMYTVDMDAAIEDRQRARAQQIIRRLGEKLDIVDEGEIPDEEELAEIRGRVSARVGSAESRRVWFTFGESDDAAKLDHDLIGNFSDLAEVNRGTLRMRLTVEQVEGGFHIAPNVVEAIGDGSAALARAEAEALINDRLQGSERIVARDTNGFRVSGSTNRFSDLDVLEIHAVGLQLREESIAELQEVAVEQAKETIKNRITELGISEANVRARDIDISVEVPGANESDFDRIRQIISQTARLEFKIVDDGNDWFREVELPDGFELRSGGSVSIGGGRSAVDRFVFTEGMGPCPEGESGTTTREGVPQCSGRVRMAAFIRRLVADGRVPEGRALSIGRADTDRDEDTPPTAEPDAWRTWLLYEQPPNGSDPVGGEHLEDASVGTDPQSGEPLVLFSMKTDGARLMAELTQGNLQRRMAIVLDDEVKSAPNIQSRISSRGQITLGGYLDYNTGLNEANDLVIVLRAGALPAPIMPQNEQLIGPTLGRDSVRSGAVGALVGIGLVLLFMALYYEVAGLVADVMVVVNVFLLFAVMAFFNNDLTLPGIAGIALTVGMAVDANVLITERIREELRLGKSARAAVDQGFGRAFWSIFDSQLTTFIAGVVLYQYGSPEIQGFAKTLMIGIVTSLFTGVFCSRVMFDWIVRGLRVSRLRVG
ncbi:MAG: protein translocase subunit SecD [Sandaracinaceae bacterium]